MPDYRVSRQRLPTVVCRIRAESNGGKWCRIPPCEWVVIGRMRTRFQIRCDIRRSTTQLGKLTAFLLTGPPTLFGCLIEIRLGGSATLRDRSVTKIGNGISRFSDISPTTAVFPNRICRKESESIGIILA